MDLKKSKRITFLGLNASYSHSMLSYGYIRAFTESKLPEWKWTLVEKTINDNHEIIINELLETNPDVIVITCYLFNIENNLQVCKDLRRVLPDIFIFLGGPEFLGENREFLLKNREIDGVFRGDETSFYQVLENIRDAGLWDNIPGLCYFNESKYIDCGFSRFNDNLDLLPSPFKKGYFKDSKPFVHFETSRGCNGQCDFCTSSLSYGVKNFSFDRIYQDLQYIRDKGIKEVRLIDRTFNESEERTLKLLEIFIKDFREIRFHLEINPSKLTDKEINQIKKFTSEKLHIEIGIQTCSQTSLQQINRYGSATKSIQGLKNICSTTNIPVHTDLIFGLPGQNFRDVIKDVIKLIIINPEEIQLEILKVLPGTSLRKLTDKKLTWNNNPPYQVIRSDRFSEEELTKLSVLSLILDSYYNTILLKNIFRFICKNDKDFIESFLEFYVNNSAKSGKLSYQERFEILAHFTEKDSKLSQLFKFSWLAAGLPRKKYNLKTSIQKQNTEKSIVIWQNPKKLPSKRNITVSFPFDIALIWLGKSMPTKHRKTTYILNIAYGNVISSIEKLVI